MIKNLHTSDPDRYLAHADECGRRFVDLLARVASSDPDSDPATVVPTRVSGRHRSPDLVLVRASAAQCS